MRHSQEHLRRLARAMNYIGRHLNRDLTLAEVAAEACFSPYHFHRLFVAMTGETVAAHQRRLRFEQALLLLVQEPQRPISNIAVQLGFSSPQNFTKSFRLFYGHSPSRIRACGSFIAVQQLLQSSGHSLPSSAGQTNRRPAADINPQPTRRTTMDVQVINRPAQEIAYIRVIGPYAEVMPDGFSRLEKWAIAAGQTQGDWLALYWNCPDQTPANQLQSDVAVSIAAGVEVSGDVQKQTIPAGLYATYRCRVEHNDFATPWNALYKQWLPQSDYQPADGPCFEQYLNDGRESGVWELVLFAPLRPR